MATNHTTNYNLNLWEPNDAFVREEFNENTSKIDEVLHRADRRGIQVLKEVVTTEATNDLTVTFPEIDWSEWNTFRVNIIPGITTKRTVNIVFSCGFILDGYTQQGNQILFFPSGNPGLRVGGIFLGNECQVFSVPAYYYQSFHNLKLQSTDGTNSIVAGTRITLYGEHM